MASIVVNCDVKCDPQQANLLYPLVAYGTLDRMLSEINRVNGTFYLQPQLAAANKNKYVAWIQHKATPYDGITTVTLMFDLNIFEKNSPINEIHQLFDKVTIDVGEEYSTYGLQLLAIDSMFVHIYELLTNTDEQWQQRATIATKQGQLCIRLPTWFSDDYNHHFPLPPHLIAAEKNSTQFKLSSHINKLLAPHIGEISVSIQPNNPQPYHPQVDLSAPVASPVIPTVVVDAFALDQQERAQLITTIHKTVKSSSPDDYMTIEIPTDEWVPLRTQMMPGDVLAVLDNTSVNHVATDFIFVAFCRQTQQFLPIKTMSVVSYSIVDKQEHDRWYLARINAAHLLTEYSNRRSPHIDNMLKHNIYHYVWREGFLNYSRFDRIKWEIELVNPTTTPVDVYVYSRVWNVLRRRGQQYGFAFSN